MSFSLILLPKIVCSNRQIDHHWKRIHERHIYINTFQVEAQETCLRWTALATVAVSAVASSKSTACAGGIVGSAWTTWSIRRHRNTITSGFFPCARITFVSSAVGIAVATPAQLAATRSKCASRARRIEGRIGSTSTVGWYRSSGACWKAWRYGRYGRHSLARSSRLGHRCQGRTIIFSELHIEGTDRCVGSSRWRWSLFDHVDFDTDSPLWILCKTSM